VNYEAGYTLYKDVEMAPIIVEGRGRLKAVVPKVTIDFSGVVIKAGKDSQKGVDFDISVAYGELAKPEVMKYVKNTHSGYTLKEGHPVDWDYCRAHIKRFHIVAANDNVYKALNRLKRGDRVSMKGYLVFWKTDDREISYTTAKDAFICKNMYITEVADEQYVYK
jgi:hypothetical protein